MFLWPVTKFWTFSPLGWLCACAWNASEILHIPLPFAPKTFEIIMGCKGRKLS